MSGFDFVTTDAVNDVDVESRTSDCVNFLYRLTVIQHDEAVD